MSPEGFDTAPVEPEYESSELADGVTVDRVVESSLDEPSSPHVSPMGRAGARPPVVVDVVGAPEGEAEVVVEEAMVEVVPAADEPTRRCAPTMPTPNSTVTESVTTHENNDLK